MNDANGIKSKIINILVLQRIPLSTPKKKKTNIGKDANQNKESSGSLSGTTKETAKENVKAARILGFNAIHYENVNQLIKELNKKSIAVSEMEVSV
jgi:hypothetical protein